jgi:hypothetical protein
LNKASEPMHSVLVFDEGMQIAEAAEARDLSL